MTAELEHLFGDYYLGLEAWRPFAERFGISAGVDSQPLPWSSAFLARFSRTHILLFAPSQHSDGTPITLNSLRTCFGMDPSQSEPCFYNQDWYLREDFAARQPLEPGWHLLQASVMEAARAMPADQIEARLSSEQAFSAAVTYAFAFFAYWLRTGGKRLWEHDFIWCRDRDHNGDRIYVGRYTDPSGINKSGFNIHRHLSLRPFYSAAPEVKTDGL